jgi:hypothetical protein
MLNNQNRTEMKRNYFFSIKRLGFLVAVTLFSNVLVAQNTHNVEAFDKVIINPHIEVTFKEGERESVEIITSRLPEHKINIEVKGKTLQLYLDGAKVVTKSERVKNDQWKGKKSIYTGTMVTAVVTYKSLKELSLRGEETFVCENLLISDKFRLSLYGESKVYLKEVDFEEMKTTVYGESYLEIKKGSIGKQKIVAYGETKINCEEIASADTKITAYGEGSYRVNAAKNLKVTAFGEATVAYSGAAQLQKGLIIGEAEIIKIN